ncbi:MAG: hypothetical protein CMJ70_23715 [Planctomycetaceae bacterium]|nr:hypothetical protein [Planctomycetaceae bacterium]|tara:strand:+ start:7709 stop:9358 length:1650 start_codon:yes stop_codon:yes gene_type:complete
MMQIRTPIVIGLFVAALPATTFISAQTAPPAGQQTVVPEPTKLALPKIADEPKAIDPSQLFAPQLVVKATQDFSDSSLREVVSWLQEEQEIVVLVDKKALNEIDISFAEPVSDHLQDAPVYLLLNRLQSMGIGWYYDSEVLYITSVKVAQARTTTVPYNVGDLMDAGYDLDHLISVITSTINADSWEETGGIGALNSLGDVLFVRHAYEQQRGVHALLQALRKHARQTFLNDPPQHRAFRDKLNANVSVNFSDTPLATAIDQLATTSESDIRLDRPALRDARIREREPLTLKLANRKLGTVLQALSLNLELTWILRDGVLWITTPKVAQSFLRTAVYDVRDLCRDTDETAALIEAIVSQSKPDSWSEAGGVGEIESAKPGTLVVTHQEQVHQEVLHLLQIYRTALRASKPRNRGEEKDTDVITVYYRLHRNVAEDLSEMLPMLIRPDTWHVEGNNDDSPGRVFVVASEPDISNLRGGGKTNADIKQSTLSLVIERSVLIIRQTRSAHEEIATIIRRVKNGDTPAGGIGGGGFGGGFFAIPGLQPTRPRR